MEDNMQQEVLEEKATAAPKKKRGKLMALLIAIAVLITAGAVAVLAALGVFDSSPRSELYWNIDGKSYVAESESGLTSRRKIKGFFDVRFLVDGEIVTYKVSDPRLIIRVDRLDLMGLVFDKEGVITDILDIEDITGGEIASYFYVMSVDENKIVANSMDNGSGISQELEIPDSAKIYLVADGAEPFGQETQIYPYDRIRVILDKRGRIDTVYVIERNSITAYCEHCEKEVMWRDWTDKTRVPTSDGHWILRENVQLTVQNAVQSGNTVIVDLNGKTVKNLYGKRLYTTFFEDGHLVIVDHSPEKNGTLKLAGTYNGQGMAVWVRYGSFKMYGGIIDASDAISSGSGVAVATSANAHFELHGGTIIGGEAQAMLNDEDKVLQPFGGSVYVAKNSTFDMYGGTIRDGVCKWYIEKEGTTKGGAGGNIYVASGGVMNWHDGEILNGAADSIAGNIGLGGKGTVLNMYGGTLSGGRLMNVNRNAGNLYIGGDAEFNMYGGTIKDGTATGVGGNVVQYGKMTMSGGLITGGKILYGETMDKLEERLGNNANLQNRNADLIITGGQIDGYVYVVNSVDADQDGTPDPFNLQISGNPVISGDKGLSLGGTMCIQLGELTEGAKIVMSSGGFVSGETDKKNMQYFFFEKDLIKPMYLEKKVFFGKFQCDCGNRNGHVGDCNGKKYPWKPVGGNTLPTLTGRYYLFEDMVDATQSVLSKDAIIYFDLNGHKVTMAPNPGAAVKGGTYNYFRAFVLDKDGTQLNITDSVGGGKIVAGARGDGGMLVNVQAKATVNIYGGTLDGSKVRQTTNTSMNGVVLVNKGGKINMYGGKITGLGEIAGIDKKTNTATGKNVNTLGGAVYVTAEGTFNQYGGTIQGGKAQRGGSVFTSGVFNLYGGTVADGYAREGGNIYAFGGKIKIAGGVVDAGTAETFGGNIYVNNATDMAMTGGEIYSGVAENGPNIFIGGNKVEVKDGETVVDTVYGKVDLTGGTVYGGLTTSGNTLTLGGSIKILDTEKNGKAVKGLVLTSGAKAKLTKLDAKAVIKADTMGTTIATYEADAEKSLAGKISVGQISAAEDPEAKVYIQDGTVSIKTVRLACLCGHDEHIGECDGTILTWMKWTSKSLPTASGNYYLAADIPDASQATVNGQVHINLDLNGHIVTMAPNPGAAVEGGTYNYFRAYALQNTSAGSVLNITDSVGGGQIISGVRGDGGAILNIQSASEVGIYGGILNGIALKESTNNNVTGVVTVMNGGSFAVYGGEVWGFGKITLIDKATNTATDREATTSGGAVYVGQGSSFTLTGGKLVANKASNGGAVYTVGNMTVSGGELVGGQTANGGSIYASGGSVTMTGGKIYGGTATKYGGNVHINNATDFTMTGGEIYGGAAETGPNIFVGGNKMDIKDGETIVDTVYGKVTLTGGTVYGGVTTSGNTVTLGESVKILDTEKNGKAVKGLVLTSGAKVKLTKLNTDAVIKADTMGATIATYEADAEATLAGKISIGQITAAEDANANVFIQDGTVSVKSIRLACLCGHAVHIGECDGTLLEWQVWNDNTLPTVSGNYYLTRDIPAAGQSTMAANTHINLDLNGHKVTMALNSSAAVAGGSYNYYRAFALTGNGSVLNISDSVGGGKISAGVRGDVGMLLHINSASTVNLYGGTLDGAPVKETTSTAAVGVINVAAGGSFNMYDGKVIGLGRLQAIDKATNTAKEGIFVYANGSAVYVASGSSFRMTGGEIVGGTAQNGGGVYVAGSFTMSGGAVYGGKANTNGNNLFVANTATAVTLTGGTIYGGASGNGNAVRLGGNIRILDKEKDNSSVTGWTPVDGTVVTLMSGENTLTSNAVIYMDSVSGTVARFADSAAFSAYLNQIKLGAISAGTQSDTNVVAVDNTVVIGQIRIACVCGGKAAGIGDHVCQNVIWEPLSPDNSGKLTLPTTDGKHYYLTADVTAAQMANVSKKNVTVSLDLNGHTVTMAPNTGAQTATGSWNYFRAILLNNNSSSAGSVYNLTDSVGGGRIISGVRNDAGAVVRLMDTATFNMYGGILDGSGLTQTTSATINGTVEIQKGIFNMYGGEILGVGAVKRYKTGSGNTLAADTSVTINGGAVGMTGGTFNMYGGSISGRANNGGAVYVKNNVAAFNMYGGTIQNSFATGGKGGNVYVDGGNFSMLHHDNCAAPQIKGGNASEGGNVDVRNGGRFTMEAGVISGGTAASTNYGGNIYVNAGSFFTMTGGEIYGGSAGYGANVFIGGNSGGSASITGGTIYGLLRTTGTTLSVGGNAQLLDQEKNGTLVTGLEMAGKTTILPLDSTAVIRVEGALNGTVNAQFASGAAATLNGQITVSRKTSGGEVWVVGTDLKIVK